MSISLQVFANVGPEAEIANMLVLSRKVGERIRIGESVIITVVRVSGGGVRLGIDAPAELPVVREELFQEMLEDAEAKQKQQHESST